VNFLAKVYLILSFIAGILASIVCIAFFGWLLAVGVGIVVDWFKALKNRTKKHVNTQTAGLA